jgi:hypothetical protein
MFIKQMLKNKVKPHAKICKNGHEDGRKQTSAAVVLDGRHTVRERFGAHRRLQKLVRLSIGRPD